MNTCLYCGTSHPEFRTNCRNCGAPLPPPELDLYAALPEEQVPMAPPAPRPIADSYAWRLLGGDGVAIVGGVLLLLGAIFAFVGVPLTLALVTALVGLPFMLLGLAFLGIGGWLFYTRYQNARRTVLVLREGDAVTGRITEVNQNLSVQVNGRNPWSIAYAYEVNGHSYDGQVTTLNHPGKYLQEGKQVCVLYLPGEPLASSIYPHP